MGHARNNYPADGDLSDRKRKRDVENDMHGLRTRGGGRPGIGEDNSNTADVDRASPRAATGANAIIPKRKQPCVLLR
ncbi:predicted protein [Plenodomus lingam JN3]|uniref:Predicted protein n=1 Tax=Leptosphaeria maculans (strain JN3 / isolate v23.1.3 / race Av1-4-5-6-7-8) TaxID=985895 RepID=E4ZQP6_LEPMJ|nr:predicted protein [Plenodomus lingam JN3]CBX94051.1 predicted protein [Plenodomus lingam JN3]